MLILDKIHSLLLKETKSNKTLGIVGVLDNMHWLSLKDNTCYLRSWQGKQLKVGKKKQVEEDTIGNII